MSVRCVVHGTEHTATEDCYRESKFGCAWEDCTAHPAKGDAIYRVSAKGDEFVGVCGKHRADVVEHPR